MSNFLVFLFKPLYGILSVDRKTEFAGFFLDFELNIFGSEMLFILGGVELSYDGNLTIANTRSGKTKGKNEVKACLTSCTVVKMDI